MTIMGLAVCCCFNSEYMASRSFPAVIREGNTSPVIFVLIRLLQVEMEHIACSADVCRHRSLAGKAGNGIIADIP